MDPGGFATVSHQRSYGEEGTVNKWAALNHVPFGSGGDSSRMIFSTFSSRASLSL